MFGALQHEADDFAGGVDDAEAVGELGVVNLVEVFVDGFEKALLFVVVGDAGGGLANGAVVGFQPLEGVFLGGAGEEGFLDAGELAGDVVFAVELGVVEDAEKDVFGEDVLEQHFAHVVGGNVGVDAVAAEFEEALEGEGKGFVGLCCCSTMARSDSMTAGRSVLKCSMARRKSRISRRS